MGYFFRKKESYTNVRRTLVMIRSSENPRTKKKDERYTLPGRIEVILMKNAGM